MEQDGISLDSQQSTSAPHFADSQAVDHPDPLNRLDAVQEPPKYLAERWFKQR
jgi:hypothetical protein